MKRELRNYVLGLLTAGFVVFAAGCQTLQPPHDVEVEALENYRGY